MDISNSLKLKFKVKIGNEKPKPILYHGDCLEEMKKIKDNSVQLILCDLPYGTTKCKWDTVISLDKLWEQYKRILIKPYGAVVLFGQEPFTSALVSSNLDKVKLPLFLGLINVFNSFIKSFGILFTTVS